MYVTDFGQFPGSTGTVKQPPQIRLMIQYSTSTSHVHTYPTSLNTNLHKYTHTYQATYIGRRVTLHHVRIASRISDPETELSYSYRVADMHLECVHT